MIRQKGFFVSIHISNAETIQLSAILSKFAQL